MSETKTGKKKIKVQGVICRKEVQRLEINHSSRTNSFTFN